MTVCREAPADLQRNWQNISEMYVALGIRRSGENGPGLAPPSTYADAQNLSYMTGPSGAPRRTIDISIWNDAAARTCFFQWAGYDENAVNSNITRIRAEHPNDQAEADTAVQAYLSTLPSLHRQIYNTAGMLNIFQQDYRREGGQNVGGGNRARPESGESAAANLITDYEIQQYAAEALEDGDQNPNYEATGGRILSGLHAIIGMMTYLTTPPPAPVVLNGATITAGNHFDLAAPTGGWRAGDRVMVDTNRIDGVPTSGTDVFRVLGSALPAGTHTVEIRRADGSIIRTPVTVNAPQQPENSFMTRIGNWLGNNWQWLAGGAGAIALLGGTYLLGRRNGGNSGNAPAGGNRNEGRNEAAERRGPAPLPAQQPAATPPPVNVNVTVDNSNDTRAQAPAEGRGSNPPPAGGNAGGYDDVLKNLEGAPSAGVLDALNDGAQAAPVATSPFAEILTYSLNDAVIEAQLRAADPALADYYRAHISSGAAPVTTIGELINRVAINHMGALSAAQTALVSSGRPATEMTERIIFELVSRASDLPLDPTTRDAVVSRFETGVRDGRGVEARETERATERREEERRSLEREGRSAPAARP